jgi:hypothetical protein
MIQVMPSFISCVDSTRLAYRNLIVFSKDAWDFILVYEVVNVGKHVAMFHILVVQQKSAVLAPETGFHHQVF